MHGFKFATVTCFCTIVPTLFLYNVPHFVSNSIFASHPYLNWHLSQRFLSTSRARQEKLVATYTLLALSRSVYVANMRLGICCNLCCHVLGMQPAVRSVLPLCVYELCYFAVTAIWSTCKYPNVFTRLAMLDKQFKPGLGEICLFSAYHEQRIHQLMLCFDHVVPVDGHHMQQWCAAHVSAATRSGS